LSQVFAVDAQPEMLDRLRAPDVEQPPGAALRSSAVRLIGLSLSRDALRSVGWRPLAQGVLLWLLVGVAVSSASMALRDDRSLARAIRAHGRR
jgi:hypothetical protein